MINYSAYVNQIFKTKDGHIYKVEEYKGEIAGKHKYKIRFVECGRVKTVLYEQIRSNTVTYSFRTPKIEPNKKIIKKKNKDELSPIMQLIPSFNLRVMALDMATQKTGYCCFAGDNLINYGLIQKSDSNRYKRIEKMIDEIMFRIKENNINFVVVEDVFLKTDNARNVKVLIVLANIQGALLYHLSKNGIKYELVSPSTWKSSFGILKHRQEGKLSAINLVKEITGIDMQEDTAEATAIAMWFLKNRVDWS